MLSLIHISLKIGIGFASLIIVLVAIFGVYSWLNTYTYNANKDDNYYLYTYRGGVPKERIINKDTGQPIPCLLYTSFAISSVNLLVPPPAP